MARRLFTAVVALLLVSAPFAMGSIHDIGAAPEGVAAPHATGTPLRDGTGLYPRAIRLSHSGAANGAVMASVVDFDGGGGVGVIYRSNDNGRTFTQVGAVHDQAASGGMCCTTLYELPKQIGSMPAGTLLWGTAIGQNAANRRMTISAWQSQDQGATWSFLSVCKVAGNTGGLWEPEFSVDTEGDLVCHFSDETQQPAHSQLLVEEFSSDGIHWSNEFNTVAPPNGNLRPGMAVVRQLGGGQFFMTYELCGSGDQFDCAAYFRTSADGANWGDPALVGTMIRSGSGQYFAHAPTLATVGNKLLVIGQQFFEGNGAISGGSGRTILVNTQGGGGAWNPIGSPVAVPNPANNYCPNYSSPLLPSADGASVLEIATDYDGGVCKPYYATGPL